MCKQQGKTQTLKTTNLDLCTLDKFFFPWHTSEDFYFEKVDMGKCTSAALKSIMLKDSILYILNNTLSKKKILDIVITVVNSLNNLW